jgi:hypothetical protein
VPSHESGAERIEKQPYLDKAVQINAASVERAMEMVHRILNRIILRNKIDKPIIDKIQHG